MLLRDPFREDPRPGSVFNSIIVINANVVNFIDLYACTYKYFDIRVDAPSLQYLYKDRQIGYNELLTNFIFIIKSV